MQSMEEIQNSFFSFSKHVMETPNSSQANGSCANFGSEGSKLRPGIPPASPYSHFPHSTPAPAAAAANQLPPAGAFHSRSHSQSSFFSIDSSPATSLSDSVSADVSMDDHDAAPGNKAAATAAIAAATHGLPPRKAHRRSRSDVPFAFLQPPSLPPPSAEGGFVDSGKLTPTGVKAECYWDRGFDVDGFSSDDLFNAYMNLDCLDALNSSEDMNSRDSGSKTNAADSSENEADSNVKGMKRSAAGDPAPVTASSRHCRSHSMDSFMGKFNFEEAAPKLPPLASLGCKPNSSGMAPTSFSLEFGNGHFTAAEMKKIMANDKLVEMAMADPKRVKRILANRQSAARSKERKMRYTAELEHKVQALQTETTTLSAQLTILQRDSGGLANQNNELKFRLQAMERQAQLRDALNDALTAEVQRLKLAVTGLSESHASSNSNQQASIDPHASSEEN